MCFNIDRRRCPEALIAEEDIICWKTTEKHLCGRSGFRSTYRNYNYKFGERYDTEFRSYEEEEYSTSINKGFHAYRRYINAYEWSNHTTIRCYIPKGTKYYFNKKEYVAESICIMAGEYVNEYDDMNLLRRILFRLFGLY